MRCLSCLPLFISLFAFFVPYGYGQITYKVPSPTSHALRQTLSQVVQLREQGDHSPVVIALPTGYYRFSETLELSQDVVGQGLTFLADNQGEVVFTSALPLNLVSQPQDNLARYSLPQSYALQPPPRCILVDGHLSTPARRPNIGFARIEKTLPDRRSGFTFQPGDLPDGLVSSNFVCDLVFLHDWSTSRLPVLSVDDGSRTLRTLGPIGCAAEHYKIDHFETQPRYFLEGHPSFADMPGEWYIDTDARQLVIVTQHGQAAPKIELPRLTTLIEAHGTQSEVMTGLEFLGIRFTGTRFPMPAGGMATAQATMHEPRTELGKRSTNDRPMLPACVHVELANQCRFVQCQFDALGASGLWLAQQTNACLLEACRFSDIGGNAINLGENNQRQVAGRPWYQAAPEQVSTGNRVTNCTITRCGRILPGAVGIWAALQKQLEIVDNHLDDCPYTGISLGWIWSDLKSPAQENTVRDNHIQRMMQVLSDGGGIYTLGRQPNSLIEGNEIHDIPLNAGRAESNGMFLDEGTSGFTIRNNRIRRTAKSPLRFHRAGTNHVSQNQWELPDQNTPPVRFNNTPEKNISISNNSVLEPEVSIFLIGNSLTWDTVPAALNGNVRWHVDCGKPLPYIARHPDEPCVKTSWLWPAALRHYHYDYLVVQPFSGSTFKEDVETISSWIALQPKAKIVVHTGWPRHADFQVEQTRSPNSENDQSKMSCNDAYFTQLIEELQHRFPDRLFVRTRALDCLVKIAEDIRLQQAPFLSLDELYRDPIHMTLGAGRYLMHNAMRQALDQPASNRGFEEVDPAIKDYLDAILER